MRQLQYILTIILLLTVQMFMRAQCSGDNIFEGTTNTDWHTASNWSASCVPTSAVTGQITIASNCTVSSGSYTFSAGSRLQIDAGFSLTNTSNGSFVYQGEITGEGTYIGDMSIAGGSILPGDVAPPVGFTCGTSTVTFTYNGSTVTYGTVVGANNTCWLDRDLGASQVATSSTDQLAYGDLFQWGRLDDGHQERTSSTTSTLSSSDVPGHDDFILAPNSPRDWRSPQHENLWQGVNGINNPCPSGFRLPTEAELDAERQSWSSNNAAGAIGSPLKLPSAGFRFSSGGSLSNAGSFGLYWSSTISGSYSRLLNFNSGIAGMFAGIRAFGYSVRCLKD